ncbi:MAG: AtpZ/AtpI family protein [Candidatus Dormibacteraeota bacterium]|uniref:AtpZ/AtpI family protein n=1 Tax=Candidatus Amunia macphersoniae TaxID=3127014 RepID=A0A934NGS2_9BACT|nr:AtpZ/AtpI family protein [Candidatus Dormibacteraeota bacterium]
MGSRGDGQNEAVRALALVTGIGVYFGVAVAVGVGLGLLFRHLLGDNPLPLFLGILVGVGAGASGVYRMVMRVYR